MKFRQSALPYLFLIVSIVAGLPLSENLATAEKEAPITYQVTNQSIVVADCETVYP